MKIVIPMSGFGERFRRAGYSLPKSLIMVEGKPMIHHVIDLFPGNNTFIFICNQDHLKSTDMRTIIEDYCPYSFILPIPSHKLGPVYAVTKAFDFIDDNEPVMVNYCDFACYWSFESFKRYVTVNQLDGAIPAYKGFHPHSLGTTNYAYLQTNLGLVSRIKEKEPFTNNRLEEYASSGSYYFKSGSLLKTYFSKTIARAINVNGEYYCSLPYNLMIDDGLQVGVYDIPHFMQWGTPDDVAEYNYYSAIFRSLVDRKPNNSVLDMTLLLPMAGFGSRFLSEGFQIPKPFLPISGKPMYYQAMNSLPKCTEHTLIYLYEHQGYIDLANMPFLPATLRIPLSETPNGQALTCQKSLEVLSVDKPVLISACDHSILYDHDLLLKELDTEYDIVVFGIEQYPFAIKKPASYAWIEKTSDNLITQVSVKRPLQNPATDPVLIGTFIFKDPNVLSSCIDVLLNETVPVNGEYYLDSCINTAIDLGLTCRYFGVDKFICWGTPDEYKTFNYWQTCFDLWETHPYTVHGDNLFASQIANNIDQHDK